MNWKNIKDAPKLSCDGYKFNGPEIFGINQVGKIKVIRWTTEYPCEGGVWMFAYKPNNYIAGMQEFEPVAWLPLNVLPPLPDELKYK